MILTAICEGMAVNAVCRTFKVGKPNVLRFIREAGRACEDWHNRHFRNLTIERLELDEQWAYVHTHRERMTKEEKAERPDRGDCWLWASMCPDSKAIINWRTGKRTARAATDFTGDLASRIAGRVQITSDQLNSYTFVVPSAFGDRADYAQEHKVFAKSSAEGHEWMRFRTNPLVGVNRQVISGTPNLRTSTVCHIERFFLTMRQQNKRKARKTLAYSKRWDNHALTASIHIFIHNMVRVHETIKTTPALALGIADRRWTLEDVVTMTDEFLRAQGNLVFEIGLDSQCSTTPTSRRTYTPTPKAELLTPWYLDPESGGPNPDVKQPGIQYDDESESP